MYAGKTQIEVDHGSLEAIYRPRREDAARVALVLHPHPVYGGTMHNPVVFHCARALEEIGFETLRFNFRGVGESTGSWDEGRGELRDASCALDFLLAAQPQAQQVVVAGFSFGAAIGLQLGCADARIGRIVAIAAPVRLLPGDALDGCRTPRLFVHGTNDELAPLEPLQQWLAEAEDESAVLRVIDGASHFFESGRDGMAAAIRDWLGGDSR